MLNPAAAAIMTRLNKHNINHHGNGLNPDNTPRCLNKAQK